LGRITAIDMNSGEHVWQVANGNSRSDHPALRNRQRINQTEYGVKARPKTIHLTRLATTIKATNKAQIP